MDLTKKKSKESHQKETSNQKKAEKLTRKREKIYTPREMDLRKNLTRKRYFTKKAYKMSPGKEISQKSEKAHQEESVKDCKAAENVDEAWLQVHFLFLREHQEADYVT